MAKVLNDVEAEALATFYAGVSQLSLAAQQHGDGMTLEAAKAILTLIEAGCQATHEKLRTLIEQPDDTPADDIGAQVIELDEYRRSGGLMN